MIDEAGAPRVVGIGASAGGIEALAQLLGAFTLDSAAFVIVMHLPRDRRSELARVLSRYTVLDVDAATSGVKLLRNHVYVVPESENVTVRDGHLVFEGHGRTAHGSRNVDHFLTSLALEYGADSVGVVLSGANRNGTAGLAAIRAAGGSTFVQSAETARFALMPESASVSADHQLDPGAIGRALMTLLTSTGQDASQRRL
ncbi:MAG: histidine kinase [Polyangiaceae bacterium]|jgi:two-component system CheB/CheR fusion protein|nr:histidine kinase [Polyangiaceae bacterium]